MLEEPVSIIDRDHRWINANIAYCEHMGCARHDLLGRTIRDMLPADRAAEQWQHDEIGFAIGETTIAEAVEVADASEPVLLQTKKLRLRDANDRMVLASCVRNPSASSGRSTAILGDSFEAPQTTSYARRTQLGIQGIRYAFSDPLTQLPNRRTVLNLLDARFLATNDAAAVAVINIDHFKLVNDRFGYATGDAVILELAQRLRQAIGPDATLGRLDNDEFIVVAEGGDALCVEDLSNRVQSVVEQAFLLGDHEYRASLSIGMAVYPQHGSTAQALVRNAGLAMRWRKRTDRGGSGLYSQSANAAEERRVNIELKLPTALEHGHLDVYYQPIVDGQAFDVVGFEALLRWSDPILGEVKPCEFIPIAEEMGIVRKLGESVIDAACLFLARFSNKTLNMSVNVSSAQLSDETFPIFVAEALQKHNIPGERLNFEITESIAMRADSSVRQVFDELSALGVRLLIDDFGTGFSNLARLKQLPFYGIKIDREFVRELPDSPADEAIFRATYAIAKAMNLAIVVEGIETAEQAAFMQTFSIECLQGYRFGQALSSAALKEYTL